jgi:hypothetical protein
MKILPLSVKSPEDVDPYHFCISFKDHKQKGPFSSSKPNIARVYDVDVWFNGLKFMEDLLDSSFPILEVAIETDGTYHFPTSRESGAETAMTFNESGRHFRTQCKYMIDEWPPKSLKDQPTPGERSRMLKPIPFTNWKVTILNPRHTLDLTAVEYVQFIFHVEELRY